MNHELNKAIESLILNKPKSQSYSTRELNYIRRYDKCEDEGLDIEETIRQIWDTEQKESPVMVRMGYYGGSCLITHGQSAKVHCYRPQGQFDHLQQRLLLPRNHKSSDFGKAQCLYDI